MPGEKTNKLREEVRAIVARLPPFGKHEGAARREAAVKAVMEALGCEERRAHLLISKSNVLWGPPRELTEEEFKRCVELDEAEVCARCGLSRIPIPGLDLDHDNCGPGFGREPQKMRGPKLFSPRPLPCIPTG